MVIGLRKILKYCFVTVSVECKMMKVAAVQVYV